MPDKDGQMLDKDDGMNERLYQALPECRGRRTRVGQTCELG